MRPTSFVLAIMILLNCALLPVYAQTAKYTPNNVPGNIGSIYGSAPTNKVGDMMSSDLKALFSDNSIEIVEEKDGNRTTKLKGVPIIVDVKRINKKLLWTGVCYWKKGPQRNKLAGKYSGQKEIIVLKNQEKLVGNIKEVTRKTVTINTGNSDREVNTLDISELKSPFATKFICTVKSKVAVGSLEKAVEGDASINFTKTFNYSSVREIKRLTKTSQNNSPIEGMSKTKKIVLGTIVLLVIATAIAVPLAVAIPAANNRRRRNNNQTQNAQLFNLLQQQQNQQPNQNQN